MPQLPTFADLGTPPSPSPNTAVQGADLGATERALTGVGDAIQQIDAHLTEARRASTLSDALGKATEALGAKQLAYKNDSDYATIPQRFKQDASDIGDSIAGSITDPGAQRVFRQEYTKLATSHQLAVMQNAWTNEADSHKAGLQDDLIANAHQAATALPGAPGDLVRTNLASVAVTQIGEMENARWITHTEALAMRQKYLRDVQEGMIQRDIDADPVGTYQRLRTDATYGADMDPIVRSRYEHWARGAAMPNEAKQDATKAMTIQGQTNFSEAAPGGGEPFIQRIRMVESGGNENAVGKAGELSSMQVLPATARAPGFGIQPAASDTAAEYRRVGESLAPALLAHYNGNEVLAAAAYNAGQTRVDQWIAKYGDPRTGQISDADFAAKIPIDSTRSYVQKVASPATQAAGGVPQTPRDVRALLGTWVANAEAQAEKSHPGDAVYRDMVVNQVKSYVGTIAQAQEGQARQASSYLTGKIMGADGGPKITSMEDLFNDPTAREAYMRLDPYAQGGIRAHVDSNASRALMLENKSAPGFYADVVRRMYLPDSDPQKITSPVQLLSLVKSDGTGLSVNDFERGKRELNDALTPEGARFAKDKDEVAKLGQRMLLANPMFTGQADKALEAGANFRADLDAKVDEYRKAGKDPRTLLMRNSPDYFATADRVRSYAATPQSVAASHPTVAAANATPLPQPRTQAEYDALPVGATYLGTSGARLVKGAK